jgi:hypothetical protein
MDTIMTRRSLDPLSAAPRRVGVLIVLALCVVLYLRNSHDFDSGNSHVPGDFKVYLRASHRAKSNTDPYIASEGSPYKYSLGALAPFLVLPESDTSAWAVFKGMCLAMWFGALTLGAVLGTWIELAALILGVVFSWKGLIETLDYGQIEFFLLIAAVLASRLRARSFFVNGSFLTGMILGFLPVFKLPWAAIAFPFLVLSIRTSRSSLILFLMGMSFGAAFLGVILPVLLFGVRNTVEWSHSWIRLLATQPNDLYTSDINQGFLGSFLRWYQFQPALGIALAIMSVSLFLWAIIRLSARLIPSPMSPLAFISPWLIAAQLINPLSWRWASLLLVGSPLAVLEWNRNEWDKFKPAQVLLVIGVSVLFLIQQNPVAHLLGFGHWTDLHHYGSITIFWMLLLLLCV